jgi:hypothetical protein
MEELLADPGEMPADYREDGYYYDFLPAMTQYYITYLI